MGARTPGASGTPPAKSPDPGQQVFMVLVSPSPGAKRRQPSPPAKAKHSALAGFLAIGVVAAAAAVAGASERAQIEGFAGRYAGSVLLGTCQ